MASLKHTHTYVKYKGRKGDYFRCDDPGCTHFAPAELAIGKNTKCTACGGEFILDRESAKRVRPRCMNCAEHKQARVYQAAQSLVSKIFENKAEDGVQNE